MPKPAVRKPGVQARQKRENQGLEQATWAMISSLEAGLALGHRALDYRTPRVASLRSYRMPGIPFLTLDSTLRSEFGKRLKYGPFALAHYRRSLGLQSRGLDENLSFPSIYQSYSLGLGFHVSVLAIRAQYQRSSFRLDAAKEGEDENDVPNIEYGAFKAGLKMQIRLRHDFELILGGDYLLGISFEQSSGHLQDIDEARGIEIEAGLDYRVAPFLSLQLGLLYQQCEIEFKQDAWSSVASGLGDRLLLAKLSVAYLWGSSTP